MSRGIVDGIPERVGKELSGTMPRIKDQAEAASTASA